MLLQTIKGLVHSVKVLIEAAVMPTEAVRVLVEVVRASGVCRQ